MRKRSISIVALILVLMSLPTIAPADIYVNPAQMGDQGGALAAEYEKRLQQQSYGVSYDQGYSSYVPDTSERDSRYLTPDEAGSQSADTAGYGVDYNYVTPGTASDSGYVVDSNTSMSGTVTDGGYVVDSRYMLPGTGSSAVVDTEEGTLVPSTQTSSGGTQTLDWFNGGADLLKNNKSITIYDTKTGTTWGATYINGANHADIIPASKSDANLIKEKKIIGSYERRPVVVTIAGTKYAGSMYAVGHGSTSYCSYFKGVMCIHFTGSKTHGSNKVDKDHQSAITEALTGGN